VVVEALPRWLAARLHVGMLLAAAPLARRHCEALLLPLAAMSATASPLDSIRGPGGAAVGDALHCRLLAVPGGVP